MNIELIMRGGIKDQVGEVICRFIEYKRMSLQSIIDLTNSLLYIQNKLFIFNIRKFSLTDEYTLDFYTSED